MNLTRPAVFLIICLLTNSLIFGQTAGKRSRKTARNRFTDTAAVVQKPVIEGPSIKWDSTDIKLGNIPQHWPYKKTFNFTNTGTKPLIIEGVFPTCGCIKTEATIEPVMPGKTGYVKIIFNAAQSGRFDKTVMVKTNASDIQDALIIRGTVIVTRWPDPPKEDH